jgi:hypothetical protein
VAIFAFYSPFVKAFVNEYTFRRLRVGLSFGILDLCKSVRKLLASLELRRQQGDDAFLP